MIVLLVMRSVAEIIYIAFVNIKLIFRNELIEWHVYQFYYCLSSGVSSLFIFYIAGIMSDVFHKKIHLPHCFIK